MSSYKEKVAIVTGGASGLGKALCEDLCSRGAHVVVADIDFERAQQVAAAIAASGGHARAAQVDVANAEQVQKLVTDTISTNKHLDYMFNNAAATATRGELCDVPLGPWHRAIDVNLLGVVHGSISAYAVMLKQGYGHIVNTGSLAGLVGFPTSIAYGASKSAVVSLTNSLHVEAAERGIDVSVVCPGPIHGDEKENQKLMGVARAAQLMLKGVERKQAMIVFPFSARFLWWISRLSPSLLFMVGRKMMRNYRQKHCPS